MRSSAISTYAATNTVAATQTSMAMSAAPCGERQRVRALPNRPVAGRHHLRRGFTGRVHRLELGHARRGYRLASIVGGYQPKKRATHPPAEVEDASQQKQALPDCLASMLRLMRVPLSFREANREPEFLGPHDGVPDWLFNSLWEWLIAQLPNPWLRGINNPVAEDAYRALGLTLHTDLDRDRRGANAVQIQRNLNALCHENRELLLDAIDLVLHTATHNQTSRAHADALDGTLTAGGSVYTVAEVDEGFELQRRTPDAAREALQRIGYAEAPGKLLTRAWSQAYSRGPDPNAAYSWAVKAIEAAAIPVVLPENNKATLGQLIAALDGKPDKWDVVFAPDEASQQVSAVAALMRIVWRGQFRHGEPGEEIKEQSQPEAEAAVHAAITLVHWFSSGAIRRSAD
jgi:hypothetical protein